MMSLNMGQAVNELVKAADYLASRSEVSGRGIGAIGFCMGGGLALTLACESPHIRAAAPFYGANPTPVDRVQNLRGPLSLTYAENDGWITSQMREELQRALDRYGKQYDVKVYPDTDHAFFNDSRPDVYNRAAAEDAWQRALSLFRQNL
jgi:carboxymethylenebutenolidase